MESMEWKKRRNRKMIVAALFGQNSRKRPKTILNSLRNWKLRGA